MNEVQTECRQCGTCCLKGGPALHIKDLGLIKSGKIPLNRLITIRKGELADHPVTGKVQEVSAELVKISGIGREWSCFYYATGPGCTIYASRPSACRVLKCWDPDEILMLAEKDTLSRLDILTMGDPLRPLVEEHELLCPSPDMEFIRDAVAKGILEDFKGLQRLVDVDLSFRGLVVKNYNLQLAEELFYFGRPIFQLLQAVGIGISETDGRVRLSPCKKNNKY